MGSFDIVVIPGDGIGPEVTTQGVRILETISEKFGHEFSLDEHPAGGGLIDAEGVAIRDETLDRAAKADAVLFGAVGLPKFDNDANATVRPEDAILGLRKTLNLWANIRPVKAITALTGASPLKAELVDGVDMVVIRELTGGLYFGEPRERRVNSDGLREGVNTMYYREDEVARIAHLGFQIARGRNKKLTSVDKANVLHVSRLWREIVDEVKTEYPDVSLEHVIVDAMTMHLLQRPRDFDVIISSNMFGDILTDEASVLPGSMGLLPSASLTDTSDTGVGLGLYEPIHGTAPDITGQGIANPLAMILSVALLLRHSCGLEEEATAIEAAVQTTINDGHRTIDLLENKNDSYLSTELMTDEVMSRLLQN
jgi:3-isopropylmalate dehydrogenase|tara:strand:- start:2324 stop:3430 length:1107 start_codon:yes stop_codon:yes gene_type:complete